MKPSRPSAAWPRTPTRPSSATACTPTRRPRGAGLRAGLSALAASVQQSGVDDGAFERVRAGAREALQRASDDPSLVALDLFREKVYSGHPYAHASVGTLPGLASLTRADVEAFQ